MQAGNCKNEEVVEKALSDLLSAEEIATMNEWISKYGEVEIDASDPAGVADAMSVTLTLTGTGTEEMSEAEQQLMLEFAQNLYQEVMTQ